MIFHNGPKQLRSGALCQLYAIRLGGEIIKRQKEKEQESPGPSKPCRKGEMELRLARAVLAY